ncbi:MAG: adenylyltransferase, partial [Pseudomonadota bacterium]|nr:adenylyltransferase [Pseudomonadota bacterium]
MDDASHIHLKVADLRALTLTPRQLCDVELLLNGGFSPLRGFLTQVDYDSVVESMRLADGTLWPMPVVLDVKEEFVERVGVGREIALYDPEGMLIAILIINSLWRPDKQREALSVYGTDDLLHPGVRYLFDQTGDIYLGGDLIGVRLPNHYDFTELRHTPAALRALFQQRGWERIIAFQTRNPMHRAHYALT